MNTINKENDLESFHVPVLLNKAVEYVLNENLNQRVIIDGTLGGGGYSEMILKYLRDDDVLISVDKDLNAIGHAKKLLDFRLNQVKIVNDNFANIKSIMEKCGFHKLSGIVLDLGLSSYQLEKEEGFSFMKNTPLDMRAFKKDNLKASDILNTFNKQELTDMFSKYGEIRNADRLSKAIIDRRRNKKFVMTFDLVETVTEEYRIGRKDRMNFLAKIFQALRIEVNAEIENLEKVLKEAFEIMISGGRIAVVSYHSLEDRIVKNFFRDKSKKFIESSNPFYTERAAPGLKILTKKPVVPAYTEVKLNLRSRSAKLRAAEVL